MTQQVPFEVVDAVLAETGAVQRPVRDLPSRVVVYLLLAGLGGLDALCPSQAALTKARRRVGAGSTVHIGQTWPRRPGDNACRPVDG